MHTSRPSAISPAVTTDGLRVTYVGTGRQTVALSDLGFSIPEAEFAVVVGPSGCGKTTLLLAIAGLLDDEPDALCTGAVQVLGRSPAEAREARQIAMAFQAPGLLPWLTVESNVRLPVRLGRRGQGNGRPMASADWLLDRVGLGEHRGCLPHELSGGLAQRASLARALVARPRVLLLDEPFSNLDYISRLDLLALMRSIHCEEGLTTLMVTHDLREAALIGDAVYVMGPGVPTALSRVTVRGTSAAAAQGALLDMATGTSLEPAMAALIREATAARHAPERRRPPCG